MLTIIPGQRMFYVPTSQLDASRLPDVVEGLKAEDVIVLDKPKLDGRVNSSEADLHMADVTVAMLYLACGGMDESHNLVLPYSWPSPTEMSGPPILSSPAIKESEYCHALVHRKEGEVMGELGMLGFSNCKFWFGKTGFHPLYQVVKNEALKAEFPQNQVVTQFQQSLQKSQWDPETFSDLCAMALKSQDQELKAYCNDLAAKEWQLLLDHCNQIVNKI